MNDVQYIHFIVNNQNYGIDIVDVQAIEEYDKVSPVIGAPTYMQGVLSYRGSLIPVYSIRTKFHLPSKEPDRMSKLIVVTYKEMPIAIEADSVIGILSAEQDKEVERPQFLDTGETGFIGRVAEIQGKIMIIIDLEALVPEKERKIMLEILEQGEKSQ